MERYKKIINKYKTRYILQNIIKSLMISCIIGFCISIILSLIFYFLNLKQTLLIYLIPFLSILLITNIFYFFKYRLRKKELIKKIDEIGFEGRLITMYENFDNDSYIAKLQREDTINKLLEIGYKKEKLKLNKVILSLFIITFVFSFSFSTFYTISTKNSNLNINNIASNKNKEKNIFELLYTSEEGGIIDGEIFQEIKENEDAEEVIAIADYGYIFEMWSDGNTDPIRKDVNIKENMNVKAIFSKVKDSNLNNNLEDFREDEQIEAPQGMGNTTNSGAAGKYEERNQVIDGNTFYKDVLPEYYEEAKKKIKESNQLTDEEKEIILNYFDNIK